MLRLCSTFPYTYNDESLLTHDGDESSHLRLVAGRSACHVAHTVLPLHLTTVCDLNFQAFLKRYKNKPSQTQRHFSTNCIFNERNLAGWNYILLFKKMMKSNSDMEANCGRRSALCSFPLHICHISAPNKGFRRLTLLCLRI